MRTNRDYSIGCLGVRAIALGLLIMISSATAWAAPVTLNLKDADINAVISTVSKVTGKNFIVDPRVKGRVTIISSRPMDSAALYQVFLSILEVHGFAAIESGNVTKIVPDASAKQGALPLVSNDAPGEGDEVVTKVIELRSVAAAQLVPILRPLVPQQGHLAAYAQSNILIISDRAANIERLTKIIQRIDTPSSDKIEVITLNHASASEVVRILNTLEQQERGQKGQTGDNQILVADERTNSILIGGPRSGRLRLRAIISHLDTPLGTVGNTRVVYLHYARAKDLVPLLTGVSSTVEQQQKGKPANAASDSNISIQADESTNALVITASPNMFRSLEAVIQQLDVRRAQVKVESVIAEVADTLAAELGIEWVFDGTPGGEGPVGFSNFGNISGIGGALATGQAPSIGSGLTLGIGTFDSSSVNFAALVRALRGDGTTNILSTPTLVTMDNEEAEIVVGQNVPFITGSYSSTSGGSTPTNPFQTIERQNVGITLKIKPQINEGDAVKLDIEQSVDSLSASSVGAADLITNTRSIKTSVIVDDGQMIVLGGLLEDNVKESEQKVPLLGDIPLLGWLFKYKTTSNDKKNLMVFMHPTIIRDAAVANEITSSKYNLIREQQQRVREKKLLMIPDERSPLLPPIDEYLARPPSLKGTGNSDNKSQGEAADPPGSVEVAD